MLSPKTITGRSGEENRQISQRDLVTISTKAHAYDLLMQVNQQQEIIRDLQEANSAQKGQTDTLLLTLVDVLPIGTSSVMIDEVSKVNKELAAVMRKMVENRTERTPKDE